MFRSIRLLLALSFCILLVIGFNTTFTAAGGKGKSKDAPEYNKKSEDKKEISSEDKKGLSSEDKVEVEDKTDSDEKTEKKQRKRKKHRQQKRKGQNKSEQWMPPGLSKKEKTQWAEGKPPGWRKGEKSGWRDSDMPPGLQKKNKNDIEKWKKDRTEASEKAETLIRDRDHDKNSETIENNAQSVSLSVTETVNAGVPADQVVALVQKSIDKDMSGEDIERVTRASCPGCESGQRR